MFYIVASKFFAFLVMPAGIISTLLLLAIYTKNRTKSKKFVISAFIFFYIFTNPILVNELTLWWEYAPTPISAVKPHDIGVILTGGVTNDNKLPKENIFLGNSSDRVGQAIELYKNKKISKILISGGSIDVFAKTPKNEADDIAKYLIISGVPSDKIFMETHSKNTKENAVNSSKILKKQFVNQSVLLITSGYHLKRAVGCFQKVGIKVTPYGSSYFSHDRQIIPSYFFPKEEYLAYSHLLFREMMGYFVYNLMGWI
jgi:uncharacterized SAM-binding protein YcdF (DUF218 family)